MCIFWLPLIESALRKAVVHLYLYFGKLNWWTIFIILWNPFSNKILQFNTLSEYVVNKEFLWYFLFSGILFSEHRLLNYMRRDPKLMKKQADSTRKCKSRESKNKWLRRNWKKNAIDIIDSISFFSIHVDVFMQGIEWIRLMKVFGVLRCLNQAKMLLESCLLDALL